MNTSTTGAIRPKSAPLNPAVPVLLEAVTHDLKAVRASVPAGSLLWCLADTAHHAASLALGKIKHGNLAQELEGHADGTEGRP